MKKFWVMLALTGTLFSATPDQVERYLMLSGAEDQLIQTEEMIDNLGQVIGKQIGHEISLMSDSQMISIRFREYIQKNLSGSEMDEVLALYGNDVLRKMVAEQVLMGEAQTQETFQNFLIQIQKDPLAADRVSLAESIVKDIYNDELLGIFFDKLIYPMIGVMSSIGKTSFPNKSKLEILKKKYVKQMRSTSIKSMLFVTRDFTGEELEKLHDLINSSESNRENRVVANAVVYAIEDAFDVMAHEFGRMIRNRKSSLRSVEKNNTNIPEGNVSK